MYLWVMNCVKARGWDIVSVMKALPFSRGGGGEDKRKIRSVHSYKLISKQKNEILGDVINGGRVGVKNDVHTHTHTHTHTHAHIYTAHTPLLLSCHGIKNYSCCCFIFLLPTPGVHLCFRTRKRENYLVLYTITFSLPYQSFATCTT